VPSYPARLPPKPFSFLGGAGSGWHFYPLSVEVPQGYVVKQVYLSVKIGKGTGCFTFGILGTPFQSMYCDPLNFTRADVTNGNPDANGVPLNLLTGAADRPTVTFFFDEVAMAFVQLDIEFEPSDASLAQWQMDVWNALYNAAQTKYYAQQQDIAAKIAELEDHLNNVDTLTLRREENEEIMKLAVAALVGDWVGNMWANLRWVASDGNLPNWPPPWNDPLAGGSAFAEPSVKFNYPRLRASAWDENVVRFINQAIEWENVVTFLYSYFWDVPDSWEFTRNLRHSDATRQAFLRAGSARVVLTLRKGWENMWTTFVHTGFPYSTGKEGEGIPYLSIAQEIAAYDDRNYPGIPPANPAQSAVRLEEAVYTTSTTKLYPPQPKYEIEVASSVGFIVGAQVVIDSGVAESYSPDNYGRQESTIITAILTTDTTHIITLAQILYPHGIDGKAYAVVQPGEKGVLIAEWNEYTPTSGTDIAVTSNLETIA